MLKRKLLPLKSLWHISSNSACITTRSLQVCTLENTCTHR